MAKKEKDHNPKFFYLLSIVSLVILFIIILGGLIKYKSDIFKNTTKSLVMGDKTEIENRGNTINTILENTISNTKQVFSEKLTEAENKVKDSLETEISNFTKSQIDALKLKVCTDWGVVPTNTAPQNEEPY